MWLARVQGLVPVLPVRRQHGGAPHPVRGQTPVPRAPGHEHRSSLAAARPMTRRCLACGEKRFDSGPIHDVLTAQCHLEVRNYRLCATPSQAHGGLRLDRGVQEEGRLCIAQLPPPHPSLQRIPAPPSASPRPQRDYSSQTPSCVFALYPAAARRRVLACVSCPTWHNLPQPGVCTAARTARAKFTVRALSGPLPHPSGGSLRHQGITSVARAPDSDRVALERLISGRAF